MDNVDGMIEHLKRGREYLTHSDMKTLTKHLQRLKAGIAACKRLSKVDISWDMEQDARIKGCVTQILDALMGEKV